MTNRQLARLTNSLTGYCGLTHDQAAEVVETFARDVLPYAPPNTSVSESTEFLKATVRRVLMREPAAGNA